MNLLTHIDNKLRNDFTFWDLGLLKTYGALFGLLVGAYFSEEILRFQNFIIAVFGLILVRFLFLLFKK